MYFKEKSRFKKTTRGGGGKKSERKACKSLDSPLNKSFASTFEEKKEQLTGIAIRLGRLTGGGLIGKKRYKRLHAVRWFGILLLKLVSSSAVEIRSEGKKSGRRSSERNNCQTLYDNSTRLIPGKDLRAI